MTNVLVPPTGLRIEVRTGSLNLFWYALRSGNVGYHVYRSLDSGGGDSGYERITGVPVDNPISIEEEVVKRNESVEEVGNTLADPDSLEFLRRTTTLDDTIKFNEVQFFQDTGINTSEGTLDTTSTYYYVITSVDLDTEEESFYSEEVSAVPLAIPVNPPLPRTTRETIAERMVTDWLQVDPAADLKPGSVVRDTIIEFPAREFERLYTLERFRSIQQSFISLLEFDDADGDGASDPVSTSSEKRLLRDALSFDSDEATQLYIDRAFDILASNNRVFRLGSTKSIGTVTFYTTEFFEADIAFQIGTVVSTLGSGPILYETLSSAVMYASIRNNYYNPAKGRYEIRVPIRAVNSGSSGNVPSGTIKQVVSNIISGVSVRVENESPTRRGSDKESNRDLAERSLLSNFTDPGTDNGYLRTSRGVGGVISSSIVGGGHELMLRDYDELRNKHVGGKVDLYIRGEELVEETERVEIVFIENTGVVVDVVDAVNMVLQDNVSGLSPSGDYIVKLTRVYNVTRNVEYDLTNSYIKDYNTVVLDNTRTINNDFPIVAGNTLKIDYTTPRIVSYVPSVQPIRSISTVSVVGNEVGPESFVELENPAPSVGTVVFKGPDYYEIEVNDQSLSDLDNYLVEVLSVYNSTSDVYAESFLITGYNRVRAYGADFFNSTRSTNTILVTYDTADGVQPKFKLLEASDPLLEGSSTRARSEAVLFRNKNVSMVDEGESVFLVDAVPALYGVGEWLFEPDDSNIGFDNYILRPVRVYNETRGADYDLSGAYIVDGTKVVLPFISGTYNFTVGISSTDSIRMSYNTSDGFPTNEYIEEVETGVVLNGSIPVSLSYVGVDESTITVEDVVGNIFTKDVDYVITNGTSFVDTGVASTPPQIQRVPSGRISTVESLTVRYSRRENIDIRYLVNRLVSVVQSKIEDRRPSAADVLAKEARDVLLSFIIYIVLSKDADAQATVSRVLAAISSFLTSLPHGTEVAQSDIIAVVEGVEGVRKVVVPLTKMVKSDGNQVIREQIPVSIEVLEDVSSQADGQNIAFYVDQAPIIRGSGLGSIANRPSEVVFTVNGQTVGVGSVDGSIGNVDLAIYTTGGTRESLTAQADGTTSTFTTSNAPIVDPVTGTPSDDIDNVVVYINGLPVDVFIDSELNGELSLGIPPASGITSLYTEAVGTGDGFEDTFVSTAGPFVVSDGSFDTLGADVSVSKIVSPTVTVVVPDGDYSVDAEGGSITFISSEIPASGEVVVLSYRRLNVPAIRESFIVSPSLETVFTVSKPPFINPMDLTTTVSDSDIFVYVNGTLQTGGVDYVINDSLLGEVEVQYSLSAGAEVEITYFRLPNKRFGDTVEVSYFYTDPPQSTDVSKVSYYTPTWTPVVSEFSDSFIPGDVVSNGDGTGTLVLTNTETSLLEGNARLVGAYGYSVSSSFVTVLLDGSTPSPWEYTLLPEEFSVSDNPASGGASILFNSEILPLVNDADTITVTWYQFPTSTSVFKTPPDILEHNTGENGGDPYQFRAVYQGSQALEFVSSVSEVSGSGKAYIDPDTNEVYVSLKYNVSDDPNSFKWYVTYIIEGEEGAQDISLKDSEYAEINESDTFIFTSIQ